MDTTHGQTLTVTVTGSNYDASNKKDWNQRHSCTCCCWHMYRGVDKSLAQPGRKQATATEDFEFHISYL